LTENEAFQPRLDKSAGISKLDNRPSASEDAESPDLAYQTGAAQHVDRGTETVLDSQPAKLNNG